MNNFNLIDKLNQEKQLSHEELVQLIDTFTLEDREYAASLARNISIDNFGRNVYFRGIIEFSNYCKNDCLYCGIRRSNKCTSRYRLNREEIMECCEEAYESGFRTFVLQSGEDNYYTTPIMTDIVSSIKANYKDCAITLSLGEKTYEEYKALYDAGADRYLLRHETADEIHYGKLHPKTLSLSNRMRCLKDLKSIGFQTGCGFMVGSPYQTVDNLANDIEFIRTFQPHMVGMGPFIPHSETPFKEMPSGSNETTLFLLSLLRIMLPKLMLPATTALGTLDDDGRKLGVLAGCNVVMPNISPLSVRKKYMLYNNKVGVNDDTKTGVEKLSKQMEEIDYNIVIARGDSPLI